LQVLLFSATTPSWVQNIARQYLKNPVNVDAVGAGTTRSATTIRHVAVKVESHRSGTCEMMVMMMSVRSAVGHMGFLVEGGSPRVKPLGGCGKGDFVVLTWVVGCVAGAGQLERAQEHPGGRDRGPQRGRPRHRLHAGATTGICPLAWT
jgi:hypothetical protein